MSSTFGYIPCVPFNKIYVTDFKNERPIHSRQLLEQQLKDVLFINGININFMRDLIRLQGQLPLLYSTQADNGQFPYLPIHSKVAYCVNTGPAVLRVYDKISVIPPIYKHGELVSCASGFLKVYPLWTVNTNIFQKDLNNILSCARCTFELSGYTTRYSSNSFWRSTLVQCVDNAIKKNELWNEMLSSIAYEMGTERNHTTTVLNLLDVIHTHWLPVLYGSAQPQTIPQVPSKLMIDTLMTKMCTVGNAKDRYVLGLLREMEGFQNPKDVSIDLNEEDYPPELKNSQQAVKRAFHSLLERDLTFRALSEYHKFFDININGTVKQGKNKYIYPGQEMQINLRPLF